MPIPTDLKTLLGGNIVEKPRIEFKETWDPEASLKTICAFANDLDNWGGGYLVIGVKETDTKPFYTLTGIPADKTDSWQKDIVNKCKRIQPEYMPIIDVVDYENKSFILVWAPGGAVRPYSSPKTMARGDKIKIPWIRKASCTIMPSEEEKRDLYNLANRIPFDDQINHEADLSNLDKQLIQSYLKQIESSLYEKSESMDFTELCLSMNLCSPLPEYRKPKNVALMFFSLNPEKYFPQAQIDIVILPENEQDSIKENKFPGPLHTQLNLALNYIKSSLITEKITKYDDRAEADRVFNYPFPALEEALCNAVYHKGYDIQEPVEVRVQSDRIVIVSHPGAERSISQENLKNFKVYNRRYRNRRIGEFLKELKLTEGRNTGIEKIRTALRKNGSPEPLFETDDDRTFFATTIYCHPSFLPVSAASSDEISVKLTKGEKLLYNIIASEGAISTKDLVQRTGKPLRTIQRYLNSLSDKELIFLLGTQKKGKWRIYHSQS